MREMRADVAADATERRRQQGRGVWRSREEAVKGRMRETWIGKKRRRK